jgi:hypothetical protein
VAKLSEIDGLIVYLLFRAYFVFSSHVSKRFFCIMTKEILSLQTSVDDKRKLIVPNECEGTKEIVAPNECK